MTSRGLLRGQPGNWITYRATPRVVTVGGGSTQPVSTGDSPSSGGGTGRYIELPGGIIIAQVIIGFELFQSAGVGDVYVIRTPRSVDRQAYPMVEGTGFGYQAGGDPVGIQVFVPRLVDRATFVELGAGDEDRYLAFQYQQYVEQGVGANTGTGGPTVTINHSCPWAPDPSEITITPTDNPGSANAQCFPFMVTATTSTTFTVNMRGQAGAGNTIDFAWKIRALPTGAVDSLIGPKKPWGWAGLMGIYAQFQYASRT